MFFHCWAWVCARGLVRVLPFATTVGSRVHGACPTRWVVLGHNHALFSVAAWCAVSASPLVGDLDVSGVAVGALVSAGAALLPDVDHPSASVARSLPPLTVWVARLVSAVGGGHRGVTHSLVGAVLFVALVAVTPWRAWSAVVCGVSVSVVPTVVGGVCVALAVRAVWKKSPGLVQWAVCLVGAVVCGVWSGAWMGVALICGWVSHIVADFVTVAGVPLVWPLRPRLLVDTPLWRRSGCFALPVLGKAGSGVEYGVVSVLVVAAVAWRAWMMVA